jgi:putative ABC transport system permease protein
VFGLGIGIASFLVLSLYIYNDLSYNHFNKNLQNIYRICEDDVDLTKGILLPKMLDQIPEVKNGSRVFGWDGYRLSYKDIAFQENIQYVDTGFFSVFSFPFKEGSAITGVHEKYGVVISTDFARKYFGNEPALGKKLQVKFENTFLHVNGVVEIPGNSSVKFGIVSSYETGMSISPWIKGAHDWYNTFSETYILLRDGTKPESIHNKLQTIVHENFIPVGENKTNLKLLALKDFHSSQESNRTLIIILTIIALGILGIAIVNFINLTITSSFSRTKEIGIKKVMGASGGILFRQIMSESLIVSFIALLIGTELMTLILPAFNKLFETNLQVEAIQLKLIILLLAGVWLLVGITSGLIPSLFWARARLIQILHGNLFASNNRNSSRNSLLIFQFVIAIILISGTIMISKQIKFLIQKDPKFDKENVVVVDLDNWQYADLNIAAQKFKFIYEELKASPYVESLCFSSNIPGKYDESYNNYYPEGGSALDVISLRQAYVGRDYFKTYGIKILSGSGFDKDLITYKGGMVLNETAMKKLGFKEASGQILHSSSKTGQISNVLGEVEDFSYQGAQNEMQPVGHFFQDREIFGNWSFMSVRSKPGASLKVIDLLKKLWQNTEPKSTVNFFFAIDRLNDYYKEYIQINKIIGWFSALAILLSCMGLFALSSYALTRKTKEIGIRKVNGARIPEVMVMLNKDFIKWVAIAIVIATPIAWFALHKWLQKFANKTEISLWIFVMAGIIVLGIAILTVSWQSWRAAKRNPVEALRYE